MKTKTTDLLDRLTKASNLSNFFQTYREDIIEETVGGYLGVLLEQRDMRPAALASASGLGNYAYRILNGQRNAGRDNLLAIAIGLRMSLPETQGLLRVGRQAMLDPRFHRDAALIFALTSGYALPACNELLYELGEATL